MYPSWILCHKAPVNQPMTQDELEDVICAACTFITLDTLQGVMANFVVRLRPLSTASDELIEQILC